TTLPLSSVPPNSRGSPSNRAAYRFVGADGISSPAIHLKILLPSHASISDAILLSFVVTVVHATGSGPICRAITPTGYARGRGCVLRDHSTAHTRVAGWP